MILAALAIVSCGLQLWQWLVARRFLLHQRSTDKSPTTPVTLLKPLKGCDAHTEACLRSWLAQDYAGDIQALFAVESAADPACEAMEKLKAEFPQREVHLAVCPERLGANAKVSKLAHIEPLAKHKVVVVSDADVHVPPDYLKEVVAQLETVRGNETKPGLVNCFYQLANPTTLAMRWEAVAVNADFWSQVLQRRSLKPLDFALGAAMVMRREHLSEIGGFRALVNFVADDYQLGHRMAACGHQIALSPVVVDCREPSRTWVDVWRHQLRWARTIRVCQPGPYFASILSNATLWPLLWLLCVEHHWNMLVAGMMLAGRMICALDLQRRLTGSCRHLGRFWLVPVKDLLHCGIWLAAFLGNTVYWRGERLRLKPDGRMEKA